MTEPANRFQENPILRPADCKASRADLVVECLLNPGVFRYGGRVGLLLRVAERPPQERGWISTPILDSSAEGGIKIVRVRRDDPELQTTDPRVFTYKGAAYLTTLSHLRLAWSDDGRKFIVDQEPTLVGDGPLESFGIEDVRVMELDGRFYLTYTAVSSFGHGVGMISTGDWRGFTRHGMILPTPNKDCALFPETIGGDYYCLHRPSGMGLGGNYIWTARSRDLLHWGDHRCVATTRPGMWDSSRVGAGASPIRTDDGWLEIYHGANEQHRYCLGAMLFDPDDPTRLIARTTEPLMEPVTEYETSGFFGEVVFTNGHLVDGDRVTIYYGASDSVICGAEFELTAILARLAVSM